MASDKKPPTKLLVPQEVIENKILLVRGKKVMLDRDLAKLYRVTTGRLNEQVKRNKERFPKDFMFQLTREEFENWRSQIAISNSEKMGLRRKSYALTALRHSRGVPSATSGVSGFVNYVLHYHNKLNIPLYC